MGFTEKKVTKALKACDNNPDRAAEWLFSRMDEPESDEEMKDESVGKYKDERPGFYTL